MPAAAWRVVAKRRDVAAAAAAAGETVRHPVAIFIARNSRTRTIGQKNAERYNKRRIYARIYR